jgi:hypothetical protein
VRVLLAALGLLLLAPVDPAAGQGWVLLQPEETGFSVRLPATPRYERSSNRTIAGRVEEHEYIVETPDVGFWVTWTRLPRVALWFAARDGIYRNVRKELLDDGDRRETAFEEVRIGVQSGREVQYRDRGPDEGLGEGRLQAFLVGRTLCVFHGRARTGAGRPAMERFFASIRLGEGVGSAPQQPAK